jgi:hypothetical protein
MPAMMRGNEGLELVLTRRQLAKLALADSTFAPAGPAVAAAAKPAEQLDARRVLRQLRSRPPEQS